MNYRHAFHAGNHADVFKHLTLSRIFALLAKKDAPYAYLDSHAGVGLYDLHADQANRTGEYLDGVARLWDAATLPELCQDYLRVLSELNGNAKLRYYPGSPELARQLSRGQDRLFCNEKHPEDGQLLKDNMSRDRRITVRLEDGWNFPRAMLPSREKRAVLLIDPPFEQAKELDRCVQALNEAIGRMRQAIVVVWYPIKDRQQLKRFYRDMAASTAPKLLRVELLVHSADDASRLSGSGLLISNPPWGLEDELKQLLPWLSELLGQSQGSWQMDWLIDEKPAG